MTSKVLAAALHCTVLKPCHLRPFSTVAAVEPYPEDAAGITMKGVKISGRPLYLDMQATSPVDPRVLDTMLSYYLSRFGNPHACTHLYDWESDQVVESARAQVATLTNDSPKEIIFTSGATESNNVSVKSVMNFYKDKKKHVITTQTEHKCALDSNRHIEQEGFEEFRLKTHEDTTLSAMFRGRYQTKQEKDPPHALQAIEEEQMSLQLKTSASEVNWKHNSCASSLPFSDPSFKCVILYLTENQHWSRLKPFLHCTTPSHFLQQLFESNFPTDAILTFFKWSQHEFQISHSLPHFCKLLILLAHDKKYSKVRSLLHTFVKYWQPNSNSSFFHILLTCSDDICINSVIVDMLLLAFVNNNNLDLALEGFKRSGNYGIKLSLVSCNAMLGKLVEKGMVGVLEFVFREMIKRRIDINLITINTVINGFCKAGKLNKAGDVVEDMKISGLLPNVVTYNTLINGFCRKGGSGKLYNADALFKEMVAKGVSPNEITYTILIHGFCKEDNVVAAWKLFNEMLYLQLMPCVMTFNILINWLCGKGKIDEALGLLGKMVGLGLEPSSVTYNTIIKGFSKAKLLKEARNIFDNIVKQGVIVNVLTFNTLIDAYCKAGNMDEATVIHDLMLVRMVYPNVSTYNCLIGGHYREGNIEAGNKLLDKMEEKGLRADQVTYNIRIAALCKRSESRKAVRLLDEMSEKGIIPSHVTYNTLMSGYCQEGNPTAALTVRRRMENEGKRPNVVSYNVLIKGFCEKGKLEEANAYLNEMLEKGLVPNRITYDIIVDAMKEKGFVPDIDGHLYADSISV